MFDPDKPIKDLHFVPWYNNPGPCIYECQQIDFSKYLALCAGGYIESSSNSL